MLKAYADEHVARGIVRALRILGMDIVTVQERKREGCEDTDVLTDALREERVLLTNDTDFLVLAAAHKDRGEVFAPIFFWPQQQRGIGDVVRSIVREARLTDYEAATSKVYFL